MSKMRRIRNTAFFKKADFYPTQFVVKTIEPETEPEPNHIYQIVYSDSYPNTGCIYIIYPCTSS